MLLLKCMMLAFGALLFVTGILVVVMDAHRTWRLAQATFASDEWNEPSPFRWRIALRYAVPACLVLAPALGIWVVIPRVIIAP
jgi:hypothetical protein